MPQFAYQVRDSKGATQRGVVAASDPMEASRALRSEGNVVVDITEHLPTAAQGAPSPGGRRRVNRDDVIVFANQLAVMVDTGVPLAEAMNSIAEQTANEGFQPVLQEISTDIQGGVEFSTALERHPKIFDNLFISMVRASEASGTMGMMLQRVAKYLHAQQGLRRKVKGAMAYPLAMLGFCVLVVVAMLIFILPRFEKIYANKSAALPMATRFLLGLSKAMLGYWPLILLAVAAAVVGAWAYFRTPGGKILLDTARIRVPVMGPMFRKASLARALRTFATMIATGVNVLDALEITAAVAGNVHFSAVWRGLAEQVKAGSSLADEMGGYPLIPRSIAQMVSAGEKAGKLSTVLDRVLRGRTRHVRPNRNQFHRAGHDRRHGRDRRRHRHGPAAAGLLPVESRGALGNTMHGSA
jgi:type IV pilus assembly protein PilC